MPVCNSKALVCEGCHTCLTSCADLGEPHQELYDAVA
jgi:ferredoxin